MNTRHNLVRPVRPLVLLIAAILAPVAIGQEKPLLDYRFDNGSGALVSDQSPAGLHLSAGAALNWSAPGSGVGGGVALGRVGDRDVFLENKNAAGKGLDGLTAFTVCGWHKAGFTEPTQGVLFELTAADGLGYRLHLSSKREADGRLSYALVSVVVPDERTAPNGAVQYSPWDTPVAVEGEWVFFAAVVDLREDLRMVTFYTGTETREPTVVMGSFGRRDVWSDIRKLGRIDAVRVANSVDFKQPIPVGFYLDDISFFGSSKEFGGALDSGEIYSVWQRSITKKTGSR